MTFALPEVITEKNTCNNIIFFSCDLNYFHEYGIPLIKSIVNQIDWIGVHCHLILKNNDFSKFTHPRVSFSYEIITDEFINSIPLGKQRLAKKANTEISPEIIYYSCARFMQLDKIFTDTSKNILQIDCDSLLFNKFSQQEFCTITDIPRPMRKEKNPKKIIASAISLGAGVTGAEFRKKLSQLLLSEFQKNAYWFIDQHILQFIFAETDLKETIPFYWNTWSFKKQKAYFRTAKGNKKDNPEYINALEYWNNFL